MAVTGTETLNELRASLAEKLQSAEDYHQRNLKGELSPDEVAAMTDLGDEITEVEGAIKAFPTIDNFREKIDGTKQFLRARSTPLPPSPGKDANGGGGNLKTREHGGGGSPASLFAVHVKSLGDLIVDAREQDRAIKSASGWDSEERKQQTWSRGFSSLEQLFGYAVDDGFGNLSPYKATTSATSPLTSYERPPGIIDVRQQRLTVADLFAQGTTEARTVRYVRENGYTNAAAPTGEGEEKPEATINFVEVDAPVKKIAVRTKISEEMWDDFQQLRSFIDGRLRFMVMQTEEDNLLNGDGTGAEIEGVLETTGIQTEATAVSDDSDIEAIHRAITKIRSVAHFEPDGLIIHPNDYEKIRLTRDGNDQFYGGGPFTGAYGNQPLPSQPGVWSQRTVITTAITAGTVLVGAFQLGGQIFRRSGVSVTAVNTNEDDFNNNLISLRAEERLALAIYRPGAFCAVTLAA